MPVASGVLPYFSVAANAVSMNEPDVTLTDLALTVECLALSALLFIACKRRDKRANVWFQVLFLATGIASAAGAIVHGFMAPGAGAGSPVWALTLFALGVSGAACWNLSAYFLGLPERWLKVVRVASLVALICYGLYVFSEPRKFITAILAYLPAIVFLFGSLVRFYCLKRSPAAIDGFVAVFLTLVSASVQQFKVELVPGFLGHNALYHLIQFVALFLLFRFALSAGEPVTTGGAEHADRR